MHVYAPYKYRFPIRLRLLPSRLQQSDESAFLRREEFRRFLRSSHVRRIHERKGRFEGWLRTARTDLSRKMREGKNKTR